jgi:hypothetical protein
LPFPAHLSVTCQHAAALPAVPPEECDAIDDWSSGDEEDPEDTAARAAMSRNGKTRAASMPWEARSRGGKTCGG